ncbi:hypothetical protein DFH09DRAFT_1124834 [Mycena vulgaris]|nr:hypothetical protein DFH09DRAFT_1124834 [Mycena vulgaris]
MTEVLNPKAYIPCTRTQAANLICSSCFHGSENLRKCTRCRRVAYCNEACQLKDWKDHKDVCKHFQKVNAYDLQKGHTLLNPANRLSYYVGEEVI